MTKKKEVPDWSKNICAWMDKMKAQCMASAKFLKSVAFIETESYEKGFADYYKKHIVPAQKTAEGERLYNNRCVLIIFVLLCLTPLFLFKGFVALLVLWSLYCDIRRPFDKSNTWKKPVAAYIFQYLLLFWFFKQGVMGAFVWGAAFSSFLVGVFYNQKDTVKRLVLTEVAGFIKGLKYDPKGKVDIARCRSSNILPKYDKTTGEDFFSYTHESKGGFVEIELSEVNFIDEYTHEGSKRERILSTGLLVLFELRDRKFEGTTLLLKDEGLFNRSSMVVKNQRGKKSKLEKVVLEDIEFEEKFSVYSENQILARQTLDPAVMERLNKFYVYMKNRYKVKDVRISFYQNRCLLILRVKKNLFEAKGFYKNNVATEYVKGFLKEINMILEIAESLKMERKARR